MEFRFDAHQDYQLRAIQAITDLFEGQPRIETGVSFAPTGGFVAVANRLDLDETQLVENLRRVQTQNGISLDDELECTEAKVETGDVTKEVRFPNFSVEMETGTGKTYVYIRTALELFKLYGLRKFIVVVPSVAIREGVLKTLKITENHLQDLYGNLPYRYYVYDSENLSQVRQFALSDAVEIMVMTIDSFNKASNVLWQPKDRLQGETPIHLVQAARPILILDEPQNMESELSVKALSALDPLAALRYSATHRIPYNLVYRLTPFEAYRQALVKRIEVASVLHQDDESRPFLRLDSIQAEKNTITARIAIHKLMKKGAVKERVVKVGPGDSLEKKAGRAEYDGFEVDEISASSGFVRFANNTEIGLGETIGVDKEALFDAQIRYTIEEHFRKQARVRDDGIKVLSLFFIDRVSNYADEDGIIRQLFRKNFEELAAKSAEWKGIDPDRVQAAYFAQKRRKSGDVELLDSVTGTNKDDEAAYNLIMRDKERLLSFDEPVSFIFSHSALREGWDNPNVFQICTLNQTASEVKKRQEVGRGVRLAVDQLGDRVHDEKVNVLTVVANESYERYVARLQTEIEDEYGKEGLPPKPANARKRGVARLRKEYLLKPEFRELWDRIKHKTRYAVRIDTEKLLREVLSELDEADIRPPRVAITKAEVQVSAEDAFQAIQMSQAKTVVDLAGRYPLPNLVAIMADLMERTTPPARLTRRTLLEVFRRTENKQAALDNPHEFATVAVRIIKAKLMDHLVDGIRYERIDEWYEMAQLELDAEIESWEEYLIPAAHSVYDQVVYDSQVERSFVEDLEKQDYVKLYLKLPRWFKVDTPVGDYNPDWAIVVEERDEHGKATGTKLYLVRETKSAGLSDLRPDEQRKVRCGRAHFTDALGVNFKQVSKAGDLI